MVVVSGTVVVVDDVVVVSGTVVDDTVVAGMVDVVDDVDDVEGNVLSPSLSSSERITRRAMMPRTTAAMPAISAATGPGWRYQGRSSGSPYGRLVSRSARTTGAARSSGRLVRTTGPEWSVGGRHGHRRLADVARWHDACGFGIAVAADGREVRSLRRLVTSRRREEFRRLVAHATIVARRARRVEAYLLTLRPVAQ